MIKNATFTSVWDNDTNITTNCKINMETGEVFDIEISDTPEKLNVLDAEYITIDDVEYPVSDDKTTKYWYSN